MISEFDAIRPYEGAEVRAVVARILGSDQLPAAVARVVMPKLLRDTDLGRLIATWMLRWRVGGLGEPGDVEAVVANYFARIVRESIVEFKVVGLDALERERACLFISNHRDIVMDSGLLNYALYRDGRDTARLAVGNNLFDNPLASDLMRLNKSFIVRRDVSGPKALLRSLSLTSRYIRHSLDAGHSVWIAQREGRAKDGWDRSDPALLKMLGLAYRGDAQPGDKQGIKQMLERHPIVPVSISYELDPCAPAKARELARTAEQGVYTKEPDEDMHSMIRGVTGDKGRVNLTFGRPITNADGVDALAQRIDAEIVAGLEVFPTHVKALTLQAPDAEVPSSAYDELKSVRSKFLRALRRVERLERPYLLLQYANVVHNKRELAARSAEPSEETP
ncbi:MAG: 1-acyl-sn-glycerol-3-phosphate acyltransferase [Pseudomonadota bacterium]